MSVEFFVGSLITLFGIIAATIFFVVRDENKRRVGIIIIVISAVLVVVACGFFFFYKPDGGPGPESPPSESAPIADLTLSVNQVPVGGILTLVACLNSDTKLTQKDIIMNGFQANIELKEPVDMNQAVKFSNIEGEAGEKSITIRKETVHGESGNIAFVLESPKFELVPSVVPTDPPNPSPTQDGLSGLRLFSEENMSFSASDFDLSKAVEFVEQYSNRQMLNATVDESPFSGSEYMSYNKKADEAKDTLVYRDFIELKMDEYNEFSAIREEINALGKEDILRQLDTIIANRESALEIHSDNAQLQILAHDYKNRGDFFLATNDTIAAKDDFEKAIRLRWSMSFLQGENHTVSELHRSAYAANLHYIALAYSKLGRTYNSDISIEYYMLAGIYYELAARYKLSTDDLFTEYYSAAIMYHRALYKCHSEKYAILFISACERLYGEAQDRSAGVLTNAINEILNFKQAYNEKYGTSH